MRRYKPIPLFLAALALIATPAFASGGGGHGKPKTVIKKKYYAPRTRTTESSDFIAFSPSAATIFKNHRAMGLLHFEYGLDIEGAKTRKRAIALAPRLRDAYGRILINYASNQYSPGDIPDVDYLIVRMQNITDRILGAGNAAFLISTIMVSDN